MSIKIAHIADTHIRNYKYHAEYRQIFNELYEKLKEEKVDYIVHCGDIAHTKTQLSPEFFDLAGDFLLNLANIAPTYVILGNHDGNLKNSNRQDAITPIVQALTHPDLKLLKNSGEVIVNDQLAFNVLSVFDEKNWSKPSNPELINIALYHGAVAGVNTDLGWTMQEGDHDVSVFGGFDFAFLGDIHKSNQILDTEGRVRYPGSTIQQNFSESIDKGFLLWTIEDKNTFDCKHITLTNPKPFITVKLNANGSLPKSLSITKGARVRVVSENNISLELMHRAIDTISHKFKPESITFLSRSTDSDNSVGHITKTLEKEDLRDIAVQEKLIKEYLKNYELDDETVNRVYELNRRYSQMAEETEDVSRNVNWRLKHMEWSNLFNYGENNYISFEDYKGLIGIFGKNFSGKSSIIDSLLFTIFNASSKGERKMVNLINQDKKDASGMVQIEADNYVYTIKRELTKYKKKVAGVQTEEAKSELDFSRFDKVSGETESLNGLTRMDTDNNIRKVFGTMDDFMNTNVSSQLDSLSFIREGSTRRKEILAKFLDLEIFEKKFKLAKDDSSDLKGALKRLDNKNYAVEIEIAKEELVKSESDLIVLQACSREIEEQIANDVQSLSKLNETLSQIPTNFIDVAELERTINKKNFDLGSNYKQHADNSKQLLEKKELLVKMETFLSSIDIKSLELKKGEIDTLVSSLSSFNKELNDIEKKSKLLDGIPCGTQFSKCKFIRDATETLEKKPVIEEQVEKLSKQLEGSDKEEILSTIQKYQTISIKKNNTVYEIDKLKLWIERLELEIEKNKAEIVNLNQKLQTYNENKEVIDNVADMLIRKTSLEVHISQNKTRLSDCISEMAALNRRIGSDEQRVVLLEKQLSDLNDLRNEFSAYELYMRCMHSNGIAYDVIKRTLPYLNAEISKILANLTAFEVFFEEEGDKLEIYIKHPDQDPRPITMASGAEKSMAGMAIRLALLQVSNLPKADIMILDEPATALDEDHIQSFTQMLEMVKSQFRTVLLISHLDSLKDVVDATFEITKEDNFACVRE